MPDIQTAIARPGETLTALSQRTLNDPLRFPELLDLNEDLSPFVDLVQGESIDLPSIAQRLNMAQPRLGRIAQSIRGGGAILDRVEQQLQDYSAEAIAQLGELNGIEGAIEVVRDEALGAVDRVRGEYGELTSLIPWLLGNR